MLYSLIQNDFQNRVITAGDLNARYGSQFSRNYLNVMLSNSEVNSTHSTTYTKFTKRVGRGKYIIV